MVELVYIGVPGEEGFPGQHLRHQTSYSPDIYSPTTSNRGSITTHNYVYTHSGVDKSQLQVNGSTVSIMTKRFGGYI